MTSPYFHEIGDGPEVKGELVFKTVAYHLGRLMLIGRSPVIPVEANRNGERRRSRRSARPSATRSRSRDDRPDGYYDRLRRGQQSCRASSNRCGSRARPRSVRQIDAELGNETMEGLPEPPRRDALPGLSVKNLRAYLRGHRNRLESAPKRMLLDVQR